MSQQTIFQRLRDFIVMGEVASALEGLKDFLGATRIGGASSSVRYLNEVLLQLSRVTRLRRTYRTNRVPDRDYQQEMAAITSAILDLIGEIEASAIKQLPVAEQSVDLPSGRLEKILGTVSQLKSLSWLHRGLECAKSVCRVVGPSGVGTGFIIRGSFLLTNNHVLSASSEASRAYVEFDFEEDLLGNVKEPVRYSLEATSFVTSKSLDFTAVRICNNNAAMDLKNWGFLEFAPTIHDVAIEDHVTIIQHPRGGPKQICLTNNKVVNVFEEKLQYTTDTMPGSSGSPVFNDRWQVVAIHHAGGNLVMNAEGDYIFANQGILFKAIIPDVKFSRLFSQD